MSSVLKKTSWEVTFTDVSEDSNASFRVRHLDYLTPEDEGSKIFRNVGYGQSTHRCDRVRYHRSAVLRRRIFVLEPRKGPLRLGGCE